MKNLVRWAAIASVGLGACASPPVETCADGRADACATDASTDRATVDARDDDGSPGDDVTDASDGMDAIAAADVVTPVDVMDVVDIVDARDTGTDVVTPRDVVTCDGSTLCASGCTSLASDPANCGACDHACAAVANATVTCAASTCGFACNAGYHTCSGACAADDSPASCGTRCTPCAAPPANAAATCTSGVCGWTCNPGWTLNAGGTGCISNAPRLVGPLSGTIVTSQRPGFRWELMSGTDGARIQVCRDRAFTMQCQTADVSGSSGTIANPLARGVWFWRAYPRSGGVVGAAASTIWEVVVDSRSSTVDRHWGPIFDVNGDGYADVAIGHTSSIGTPMTRVHFGGPGGIPAMPSESAGTSGGYISRAGDVNGDGYGDLLVATGYNVFVFLGSATGIGTTAQRMINSTTGSFGFELASAGDVNGDGYADILVGDTATAGGAYLYYGSANGITGSRVSLAAPTGSTISGGLGASVAGLGDIDGDGYDDVAVGQTRTTSAGRVMIYLGRATTISPMPSSVITASTSSTGDDFGGSIASAGDLDGDGYPDVAIGATGGNGAVHLYRGGATGLASTAFVIAAPSADGTSSRFGISVNGAGDVNGDGYDDLLVGAYYANSGAGRAHVYAGGAGGVSAAPTRDLDPDPADGTSPHFGRHVVGLGDTNGDGFADVAVTISPGTSSLHVYVYDGSNAGLPATPTVWIPRPVTSGTWGTAVAFMPAILDARSRWWL